MVQGENGIQGGELRYLTLGELPPPPPGKTGWPWTEGGRAFPDRRSDGSAWPSVTVVTPSYNQGQFIEETIRSVVLQGYPNLRYVVIDGGSTDGTVDVLKRYERWIDHWRSEPDSGQVDAILKGLAGPRSDYFTWLNSDDLFEASALISILDHAKGGALAGIVTNFNEIGFEETKKNVNLNFSDVVQPRSNAVFHQPGVIWPYDDILISSLDLKLHYCFDRKLLLFYLSRFRSIDCFNVRVARFRHHSESKTVSQSEYFYPELIKIYRDYINIYRKNLTKLEKNNIKKLIFEYIILDEIKKKQPSINNVILSAIAAPGGFNREMLGAVKFILKNRLFGRDRS